MVLNRYFRYHSEHEETRSYEGQRQACGVISLSEPPASSCSMSSAAAPSCGDTEERHVSFPATGRNLKKRYCELSSCVTVVIRILI